MSQPLAALSEAEAEQVLHDLVYLNMQELRRLCDAYNIPYVILAERSDGEIVKTKDVDRKGIVLARLRQFLSGGAAPTPTLFRRSVVSFAKRTRPPKASDKALYGQYKNGDREIERLMKRLTRGRFTFGAIAQETLRARWASGEAPTYAQFAQLWLAAVADHKRPNPEWAYLSDLVEGRVDDNWRNLRAAKAKAAIALIERATAEPNWRPNRPPAPALAPPAPLRTARPRRNGGPADSRRPNR
jgi:hypothetical protein